MKIINRIFFCFIVALLFGFSPATHASPPPSLPVNWQQDSINWGQLQTLFSQNPGVNNFNLSFPNGLNWDMDASVVQAMHSAFVHHAQVIGLKADQVPDMSFSSLASKYTTKKGVTTIPIDKFTDDLQAGEMDMLNELDNVKFSLWNYLPEWLQKFLTMLWDGVGNFCDYVADEFKKIF